MWHSTSKYLVTDFARQMSVLTHYNQRLIEVDESFGHLFFNRGLELEVS